jgi:hypothetical protein
MDRASITRSNIHQLTCITISSESSEYELTRLTIMHVDLLTYHN